MAVAALPHGVAATIEDALALTDRVFERAGIEVPAVAWNGRGFIRLSAQLYNRPSDYERLAEVLPRLL
jgi:isopenicillin-N epimerase